MRVLMLAFLLSVSGCTWLQKNPTADQLLIEELTAVAIQSGCATTGTQTAQACYATRAAKVLAISKVLQTLSVGMAVTDLQNLLSKELLALQLTPEEVAPLNAFVASLLSYVATHYGSAALTTASITAIQTVAGCISQEASIFT
jgi:hypothetical protein